jgi:hypothetical protein
MKTKLFTILGFCLLLISCSEQKKERFNYTLIKSMMNVTSEQAEKFDAVTATYTKLGKETYEKFHTNKEQLAQELQKVGMQQDAEIKSILNDEQYLIYEREIKIEREGREQHNMKLISEALALDSAQRIKFTLANEAFYTTLIDNHDNYHGKPDVYLEYYKELDVSRKAAFKKLMTEDQYSNYLKLADQYNIGKSEH